MEDWESCELESRRGLTQVVAFWLWNEACQDLLWSSCSVQDRGLLSISRASPVCIMSNNSSFPQPRFLSTNQSYVLSDSHYNFVDPLNDQQFTPSLFTFHKMTNWKKKREREKIFNATNLHDICFYDFNLYRGRKCTLNMCHFLPRTDITI